MNTNISVIMSVYNGEKYLHEAIESILNQKYKDFEFIIIDDGSTDDTADILKTFRDSRMKIITNHHNMGLAKSLNEGIKKSIGKYIARMDADDISHLKRLQKQFDFMENNPNCIVLGTQAIVITSQGKEICVSKLALDNKTLKTRLPKKCPFYHGSVMFRKEVVMKGNLYPEVSYRLAEDMFLWNGMAKFGEFRNLPLPLYYYRLVETHGIKLSRKDSQILDGILTRTSETNDISDIDKAILRSLKPKRKYLNGKIGYYLIVGKNYLENNNDVVEARTFFLKAIQNSPLCFDAWFNLILSFFPIFVIKKWKLIRSKM